MSFENRKSFFVNIENFIKKNTHFFEIHNKNDGFYCEKKQFSQWLRFFRFLSEIYYFIEIFCGDKKKAKRRKFCFKSQIVKMKKTITQHLSDNHIYNQVYDLLRHHLFNSVLNIQPSTNSSTKLASSLA